MISVVAFVAVLVVVLAYAIPKVIVAGTWLCPGLIFFLGGIFTAVNWRSQERYAERHLKELFLEMENVEADDQPSSQ